MNLKNFRGLDLKSVDFREGDYTNSDFTGADLRGVDLCGLNLQNSNFWNTKLDGAIFEYCNLEDASFLGQEICLAGVNFAGANLKNAKFSYLDLSGARFADLNCSGTKFFMVEMKGSEFRNVKIRNNSSFIGVDLSETIFDSVQIKDTSFYFKEVEGLTERELTEKGLLFSSFPKNGIKIDGGQLTDRILCKNRKHYSIFTVYKTSFVGARIKNVTMESCSLIRADFTGADIQKLELFCGRIDYAVFKDARLTDSPSLLRRIKQKK